MLKDILNHTKAAIQKIDDDFNKLIFKTREVINKFNKDVDLVQKNFNECKNVLIAFSTEKLIVFKDENNIVEPIDADQVIKDAKKSDGFICIGHTFHVMKSKYRFIACISPNSGNTEICYTERNSYNITNWMKDVIAEKLKEYNLSATKQTVNWLERQNFDPEWATSTVVNILKSDDFSDFYVLNDALQDASCTNETLLELVKIGEPETIRWLKKHTNLPPKQETKIAKKVLQWVCNDSNK